MKLTEVIAAEFRYESAVTRRVLERVPEAKFGWKPHERSMSLGGLAAHLAEIPSWAGPIINMDVFEFDMKDYKAPAASTVAELLAMFDRNVAEAGRILESAMDEALGATWQMKMGGKVAIEGKRIEIVRGWLLNHAVHHRGQLSVYLRLLEVPVPAIYGPSADEPNPAG